MDKLNSVLELDEFEKMFLETWESLRYENGADKIIKTAEEKYLGLSETTDRDKEKEELEKKLGKCRIRLNKCKNIKGKPSINKKRAEKRKKLRCKIADYELRLADIRNEEKGSKMKSENFM